MQTEQKIQKKNFFIPKPGWLQILLPFLLLIVACWISFGRLFFGVGGWMLIATTIFAGPIFIGYILTVWVIISTRARRSNYVFSKIMKVFILTLFTSGLILGLTLVDGGDMSSTVSSVFLNAFGLTQDASQGAGYGVVVLNGILYLTSALTFITSAIAVLVLAIIDKPDTKRVP